LSKIIFVTNPSKQHTPRLVLSLSKVFNGKIYWLSSILFNPPFFLRKWAFFQQRKSLLIPVSQMIVPGYWWLREIILRLFLHGESRNFIRDRLHDFWVCRQVKKYQPQILIGSEKSCKNSFHLVKKYKGICILDLAQIHVYDLKIIRHKYAFLKNEWGNDFLFDKIQKIKLMEYDLADIILVISMKMKVSLLKYGISPNKILLIYLGFDPQIFYRKIQYPVPDYHSLKLIFVGNLSEAKGITFLLKLMEKLAGFPISLTLIGSNARSFRGRTNLPNIFFGGIKDQSSVANYLHKADVFVFPSYLDSWGIAVVEAMACGLPVIVSDEVGASECIDDKVGFILPHIENQWINAILILLYNPNLTRQMGVQAAMNVSSFTWENYQSEVIQRLEKVIHGM
jgi:glycosyltransferase involved in cell wall biosynthesis